MENKKYVKHVSKLIFDFLLGVRVVMLASRETRKCLKPGSYSCDKHNTSEIKHKHKKNRLFSFFLVLMLMLISLVLYLSHECEPGLRGDGFIAWGTK